MPKGSTISRRDAFGHEHSAQQNAPCPEELLMFSWPCHCCPASLWAIPKMALNAAECCRMEDTAIARVSDDFYPLDSASWSTHIGVCAFNTLYMGTLIQVGSSSKCCSAVTFGACLCDIWVLCDLPLQPLQSRDAHTWAALSDPERQGPIQPQSQHQQCYIASITNLSHQILSASAAVVSSKMHQLEYHQVPT